MLTLDYACLSDPGRKRRNNEDSAVTDESLGLALIADGMGGYKAGEVASAIAARIVARQLREKPATVLGLATGSTPELGHPDSVRPRLRHLCVVRRADELRVGGAGAGRHVACGTASGG